MANSVFLQDMEEVILARTELAIALGINAALAVQQIDYWLENYRKLQVMDHYFDGRWWVYNSYANWRDDNFPWLSCRQIRRILTDGLDSGIFMARERYDTRGNQLGHWWTIDYQALDMVVRAGLDKQEWPKRKAARDRRKQRWQDTPPVQNVHTPLDIMATPPGHYGQPTETTTENTKRSTAISLPRLAVDGEVSDVIEVPNEKPKVSESVKDTRAAALEKELAEFNKKREVRLGRGYNQTPVDRDSSAKTKYFVGSDNAPPVLKGIAAGFQGNPGYDKLLKTSFSQKQVDALQAPCKDKVGNVYMSLEEMYLDNPKAFVGFSGSIANWIAKKEGKTVTAGLLVQVMTQYGNRGNGLLDYARGAGWLISPIGGLVVEQEQEKNKPVTKNAYNMTPEEVREMNKDARDPDEVLAELFKGINNE